MLNVFFLRQLPVPLLHHILSYTYQPQPLDLLMDIRSYSRTLDQVKDIYRTLYQTWMDERGYVEVEEEGEGTTGYEYWLMNDIIHYLNRGMPTITGYTDDLLFVFQRQVMMKSLFIRNVRVYHFISCVRRGEIAKELGATWGLMTRYERDGYVEEILEKYTEYLTR